MNTTPPSDKDKTILLLIAIVGCFGTLVTMYSSISGRALEIERRISRIEGNLERLSIGQRQNERKIENLPSSRDFGGSP